MSLPNFDGEDPIKIAFGRAYTSLETKGINPNSLEGKKALTEVISLAGQLFEGFPPLPGTEKISVNVEDALKMILWSKPPQKPE
ncbi:MAG: hypothetical protein WCL07_03365 [bacterium]